MFKHADGDRQGTPTLEVDAQCGQTVWQFPVTGLAGKEVPELGFFLCALGGLAQGQGQGCLLQGHLQCFQVVVQVLLPVARHQQQCSATDQLQ